MTIGVYSLFWEPQDLMYIGQSDCIERREQEHMRALKAGKHFNYKVQHAHDQHGPPQFILLSECDKGSLDLLEIYWVNEFNSISHGLNIAEPGSIRSTAFARNSKYSKIQILRVFALLVRGNVSASKIADRTGVGISVVKAISAGTKHTWLSSEYPEKYTKMLNACRNLNWQGRTGKSSTSYCLTSPGGVVLYTDNLKEFITNNPVLSENSVSAYSILHRIACGYGRNKTYKGWTASYNQV
jgi:hypothetical protein